MVETPYAETEYLLAVMNDDAKRANELLDGMSEGEKVRLERHLGAAAHLSYLHRITSQR